MYMYIYIYIYIQIGISSDAQMEQPPHSLHALFVCIHSFRPWCNGSDACKRFAKLLGSQYVRRSGRRGSLGPQHRVPRPQAGERDAGQAGLRQAHRLRDRLRPVLTMSICKTSNRGSQIRYPDA